MKQVSLFLAILLLAACDSIDHIPASITYYGVDFSKYGERGFLVTPEMYTGEHDPVGLYSVELTPEMNNKYITRVEHFEGTTYRHKEYKWVAEPIDLQAAVDSLVEMSIGQGADALVNYKTTSVTLRPDDPKVTKYRVSGFAIKRK